MDFTEVLFYGILDTGWTPRDKWTSKCRDLIEGGAGIIQLRAKTETAAERAELLEEILPLFENCDIPLIINDDIDLCLKHPHLGLHIGQEDIPVREARKRLGPDRILGLSTHALDQVKEAMTFEPGLISYFAIGPVFPTQTKPDYAPIGLQFVSQVVALQPSLPFFCIGGITRKNIPEVQATGARRVVIVSDVLAADDSAEAVRTANATLRSGPSSGS